jgi:hypothetical protein
MITRIIIIIVAAAFIASIAFGQMRYSRSRSASPTPAPTPTPTPLQKTVPAQTQPLIPAQKVSPPPRTTPTPTKPALVPRVTPTPAQPKPTPLQKTASAQTQPLVPAQKSTPMPRTAQAPIQPKSIPTPAPTQAKPTPTPVPPPDVKAYLDRQVASSKDNKFHMTVNGKDLAFTPFHVWAQKSTGPSTTSTCIDMRGDDGRIYDIDFITTGSQVSGIRIHKINGESLR